MIDAKEYEALTGKVPTENELEAVNCDHAGEPRHESCGVCAHGLPNLVTCEACSPPHCHWCDTNHSGERTQDGKFCPGPLTERPQEWDPSLLTLD